MNNRLRDSIGFGILWGIFLSFILLTQDAVPVAMGVLVGLLLWGTAELMLSRGRLARLEREIVETDIKIKTLKEIEVDRQ